MKRVPPTLSRTHSFLSEVEGLEVVELFPLVAAAISKRVSAERDIAAVNYMWASLVMLLSVAAITAEQLLSLVYTGNRKLAEGLVLSLKK